jgi:class 3 adenylate cyclase/predicted ATPase
MTQANSITSPLGGSEAVSAPEFDLAAWLRSLGLERYAAALHDAEVTPGVLTELTEADLRELGLPLGPRKILLKAIRERSGAAEHDAASFPTAVPASAPGATAERRQLTVMFVDLVGSTALASRLDPEEMGGVLKGYQNAVAGELSRFEGHIAKLMGDGVLAYFGWPRAHENEAERAVHAGLGVTEAVARLAAPEGAPLAARVGIATGLVVVGELTGAGEAQERAVVGETPNLAARLQALAEPGSVVIGPSTRHLVGGLFDCVALGAQALKGFAEPVRAWRVLGRSAAESRFEARQSTGLTPLVGREEELALLLRRWEQAKVGEGQVVLLSGEPGIGKSRLVRALRESLGDEPRTRLSYHCSPYHATSPLRPVMEQLERAAGFERNDPAEAKLVKLETLLREAGDGPAESAPLLAALLAIPTGDRHPPLDLTPQRQRVKTLEALLAQLVGLAARGPVLVVLEDAHWSDPSTRELFDQVVERVRDLPVIIVITFRPEFQPSWLGQPHGTLLTLNRLSRRQGAALVGRVTGARAMPEKLAEQIVAKADGVPLFVEELTKAVLESGLLEDARDHHTLRGPLPPLAIPATLHDSLLSRLDRLAPVREVAQIGAAIGREFSYDLLAAVAPLGDDELRDALARLVEAELVFRRGTPPHASYAFKHALVQDAAYQSLLKSRRRQLHARVAQVLQDRFPEIADQQPELLAHHLTESEELAAAAACWGRAARRAAQRFAHREAIAHAERGLELIRALPKTPESAASELALQLNLAESGLLLAGYAAPIVGGAYRRAAELAMGIGDPKEHFRVLDGLWIYHLTRGGAREALETGHEMRSLAEKSGGADQAMFAAQALGISSLFHGLFREAREHLGRVLALHAATSADPRPRRGAEHKAVCLIMDAQALWLGGCPDQAEVELSEALARADASRHPFTQTFVRLHASSLHLLLRRPRDATTAAEAAAALATEHGFNYLLGAANSRLGAALAIEGHEDGLELAREGLAAYRATGGVLQLVVGTLFLIEALLARGRITAAADTLAEAQAMSLTHTLRCYDAEFLRLAGALALMRDGPALAAEAEDCFGQAIAKARQQGARSLEIRAAASLARLWRDQGKRDEAHELLSPIYGRFTEGFDTPDLREAKALLDGLG